MLAKPRQRPHEGPLESRAYCNNPADIPLQLHAPFRVMRFALSSEKYHYFMCEGKYVVLRRLKGRCTETLQTYELDLNFGRREFR